MRLTTEQIKNFRTEKLSKNCLSAADLFNNNINDVSGALSYVDSVCSYSSFFCMSVCLKMLEERNWLLFFYSEKASTLKDF